MIFSIVRRLQQPLQLRLQLGDNEGRIARGALRAESSSDYEKTALLQDVPRLSEDVQCAGPFLHTLPWDQQRLPETDEIRLLKLTRAAHGDISGTLETFSLEDIPKFYALSYVWGNKKAACAIYIDGKKLHVTRSLHKALTELSRPDGVTKVLESEYIWIDQICIDQGDTDERRHQVTLMGSIYSKAVKTIIWLGGDDYHVAEPAFKLCQQVELLYLRDRVIRENPTPEEAVFSVPASVFTPSVINDNDLPPLSDPRWQALNSLLRHSWFSRLWVQQEAILSRADPLLVSAGSCFCPLLTVSRAYEWLIARDFHHTDVLTRHGEALLKLSVTRTLRGIGVKKDLACALADTRELTKAKDPRDKIFGLMGIAEDTASNNHQEDSRIRVDYSAEYTATQAYMDAAWHIIRSSRNLAILAGPKLRNENIPDHYRSLGRQRKWGTAPSWVPNFDSAFHPGSTFATSQLAANQGGAVDTENKVMFLGWINRCNASKDLPISLVSMPRPAFERLHEKSQFPSRINPIERPEVLSIRGLTIDSVRMQQEITTSIAAGAQIYSLAGYLGTQGTIDRDYDYIRSLSYNHGYLRFSPYIWHSFKSGRKHPCMLRIWEAALELTDRSPDDLAYAALMVGTAFQHPSLGTFGPAEYYKFQAWLKQMYSRGKGEGRGIRRLRRKGLNRGVEALKVWLSLEELGFKDDCQPMLHLSTVNWTNLRRYFVTAKGKLGVGPPGMREGDSLCVLFGGGAPFVLRRHQDHWLMIGEAYVEGYMHGQAIDAWEKGELKEEVFHIH